MLIAVLMPQIAKTRQAKNTKHSFSMEKLNSTVLYTQKEATIL